MTNLELVYRFWSAIEGRDWTAVLDLLDPHFMAEWPQSGERFARANFVRANQEYPGSWHIRPGSFHDAGEWVVSEVEVDIDGRVDRCISFFRIQDNRVVELREYWPDPFPIPEWRRAIQDT